MSDRYCMSSHFLIHSLYGKICLPVSVSQTIICDGLSLSPIYPRSRNTCSPESQWITLPPSVFHVNLRFSSARSQGFSAESGKFVATNVSTVFTIPSSYSGRVHQSPQRTTRSHDSSATIFSVSRAGGVSVLVSVLLDETVVNPSHRRYFSIGFA